jgi:hypothetical protein
MKSRSTTRATLLAVVALSTAAVCAAGPSHEPVTGQVLAAWTDASEVDPGTGQIRCATPERDLRLLLYGPSPEGGSGADCSDVSTNPDPSYDSGPVYQVPVWVHVIMDSSCTQGVVSDELITSQIEILNEDFRALAGTPGENGTDVQVGFVLVGATRSCDSTWFNDSGNYFNTLARDPVHYLNIYTNEAGGALGYVPFLPADAGGTFVGQNFDRVVIYWPSMGRNSPFPPYDQGRTATHEVGHYLGLEHPFSGGCGTTDPPGCYSTGDLICDTNPDASPHFDCPVGAVSCGGLVSPIENYMEYSDDTCMTQFTLEQSRRNRCTVAYWRPGIQDFIFFDGFESGDTTGWTAALP